MIARGTSVLLFGLLAMTAGCSGGKSNRNDGAGPTPPPPVSASYVVAVTGVDIVNKDTGETLVVGGLPAQGGQLNVP